MPPDTKLHFGSHVEKAFRRAKRLIRQIGPGLVAGASDNDPTSVATLSVIGSTTVYGLLWLIVLILPMLLTIQLVSARVAVLAGKSLQHVIRVRFGLIWAIVSMALVVLVNVVTLAADLAGGAAALSLLFGAPYQWFLIPLAVLSGAILMIGRYRNIQQYLRLIALVFLTYIAAGFLAQPNWEDVLRHTFIPSFELNPAYIVGTLALLGSTLTSYVYFWETIEEEEEHPSHRRLGYIQFDAGVGILFTVIIFWFIVVSSGATAGQEGILVRSAEDAAIALTPLAGPFATQVFALGLLASSLLALPVLAATTAYVVTETFDAGHGSIEEPVNWQNFPFYMVISLALIGGAAISYIGIDPLQLLFIASVAGGLGTPISLYLLFSIASDEIVMGQHRISGWIKITGIITGLIVTLSSIAYLVLQIVMPGTS